jgi:hypothetical protein
MIEALL